MVGLVNIYVVPLTARNRTADLKIQLYGERNTDMREKTHIEAIEIVFAFRGIAPVSKNSFTWEPNNLLFTTNKYRRGDDLIKRAAAMINQTVPGIPGIT